jgi:hypothetical protein
MREFNLMAQDIANFGEGAHMTALMNGTYDDHHARVLTQVSAYKGHVSNLNPIIY